MEINKEIIEVIEWWDQFSELCAGKSKFASEAIKLFYEELGKVISETTITEDEIPKFVGFLKSDRRYCFLQPCP